MPVVVRVPAYLRRFTGGRGKVEIDSHPTTVGEALAQLWALYPALRDPVMNEQPEVRPLVRIFVGNENVRFTHGLATPVANGSEINIAPARE